MKNIKNSFAHQTAFHSQLTITLNYCKLIERITNNYLLKMEEKMNCFNNVEKIKKSIIEQEKLFDETLILNPVENLPNPEILKPCSSFMHGLYNTDSLRTPSQKIDTKIQFSGRTQIAEEINEIYCDWAKLLKAEKLSMRYLSGLHAHIVILMSISEIGQRIMALPEKAGGHLSSYAIIKRLGLEVKDIPYETRIRRTSKRINSIAKQKAPLGKQKICNLNGATCFI